MATRMEIRGEDYRATVPAIEALLRAGNRVTVRGRETYMPGPDYTEGRWIRAPHPEVEVGLGAVAHAATRMSADQTWTVYLTRPVPELRFVAAPYPDQQGATADALRLADEPPYPGEFRGDGWREAALRIGCPGPRGHPCGSVLIWAEASYVPGWRFCLRGHFAFLRRIAGVGEEEITYEGRIPATSQYAGVRGATYGEA